MGIPEWASRPEERTLHDGETLFQGVSRVVDAWRDRNDEMFRRYPAWLRQHYPERFGAIDDEALGRLCSLAWMDLAGRGAINAKIYEAWWRKTMSGA